MTREYSQIMKGVAILLMLFLHLSNNDFVAKECHNFIFINGIPLVTFLARASNPVAFFLILGGYGLFKVNQKGDCHRWSRLAKLFVHYWITLIIFVTIGHFIKPDLYPGSIIKVIDNFTSFDTSYNAEMWFLFPYVILSILSPWLFRLTKKIKAWKIITCTLFIYICTSYTISRFGKQYLFNNMFLYNPLLVFHLLFSFFLGAMAAREHFFERLSEKLKGCRHIGLMAWTCIILLVVVNCVFKYNFFYAFLIITCLLFAPMPRLVKKALVKLGNQSMNMWMIHTWFCVYLFHNFIYSFEYPLVIFAVLTVISYISSLIVNMIAKPIEQTFLTKTEIKAKPIL